MNIKLKKILLPLTLTLSLLSCADPLSTTTGNNDSKDTIKIGLLTPLSGSLESLGVTTRNAVNLAVTEINADGGVLGKQLELVVADDGTDNDKAVAGAKELKSKNVVAIVGPATSGATLKVSSEVTIPDGALVLSNSATSPAITSLDDKNTVWRTAPSDAFQGLIAARAAFTDYSAKTAAVLFIDNAYGKGLADAFKAEFTKQGGEVKQFVSYPDLDPSGIEGFDYNPKLAELTKDKPDLLFLVTYAGDGSKITFGLKDLIKDGYNPKLMGCDGNKVESFIKNGEPSIIANIVGTAPSAPETNKNFIEYKKRYAAKFGVEPASSLTETAYDAIYLLAYAMVQGDSTETSKIIENLPTVSKDGEKINVGDFKSAVEMIKAGKDVDYEGVSGAVDFDENGDVTSGTYTLWEVKDGKFSDIKTVPYP